MASLKEIFLYEAMYSDKEPPKSDYPSWICTDCAIRNGGRFPRDHISSFHIEECGWCKKRCSVTQPRDLKYPSYPGK